MNELTLHAFLLTLIAGLSTGIGSCIALLARRTNRKFLSISLGFSAGVMVYVSMVEILSSAHARRALGLPADKPLVASVWGSLGAGHMNEIMTDFIVRACANPFFGIIHSTGKAWYKQMTDKLAKEKPGYEKLGMDVREYIYDMPLVMAAADLVMCRAGASTLAELTAMGKPAVLIPSPCWSRSSPPTACSAWSASCCTTPRRLRT